jgi:hypothetical protein
MAKKAPKMLRELQTTASYHQDIDIDEPRCTRNEIRSHAINGGTRTQNLETGHGIHKFQRLVASSRQRDRIYYLSQSLPPFPKSTPIDKSRVSLLSGVLI